MSQFPKSSLFWYKIAHINYIYQVFCTSFAMLTSNLGFPPAISQCRSTQAPPDIFYNDAEPLGKREDCECCYDWVVGWPGEHPTAIIYGFQPAAGGDGDMNPINPTWTL